MSTDTPSADPPLDPSGPIVDPERVGAVLTEQVSSQDLSDLGDLGDPAGGRRQRRLAIAGSASVTHLLDLARGRPRRQEPVDELLRWVGYGEAVDGHDLGPVRATLRIAAREGWSRMRDFAAEHGLTAADLGRLGDALFDYVAHADEQVTQGHVMAQHALARDEGRARIRLLDALLSGAEPDTIAREAVHADWPVPTRLVVLVARFHGSLETAGLPDTVLARTTSSPGVAICAGDLADEVAERFRTAAPGVRVAVSWPVPVDEVPAAHGWCTRTLGLVDRGVIAPVPVLWCRDHRTQMWLHADPVLRQDLCQHLLQPLLDVGPHSRETLSETLLAWLESRASAPAIATRLGVHPQTVRYRWKRIHELFGTALDDPEFLILVTMLLKASVPLWRAGDRSDFERYRATAEARSEADP